MGSWQAGTIEASCDGKTVFSGEGAVVFAPHVAKPTTKSAEPQRPAVAARGAHQNEDHAARISGRDAAPSWNFSKIPVLSSGRANRLQGPPPFPAPRLPGPIQAKLKVGAVNDPLEHEADRVADQVLRMPAPEISAAAPPQVSRKCAECEEEEKLQKKAAGPQAAGEAPALVHDVLRSPGQPLDAATQGFFESRFGQDFSAVRVHTGTSAEQSARDIKAHAYTVGHNMVFGAGRFAPGTHEGRRLLAHELTHVVQQSFPEGRTDGASVQRACLPESDCATPKGEERAGSAKQFAKQAEVDEAPKFAEKQKQTPAVAQAGGHGRRATEVEKLFQEHLPELRPLVHGVFVGDTVSPKAAAELVDCVKWAKEALPPTADKTEFEGGVGRCIIIPKTLEDEAGKYRQATSGQMAAELRDKTRQWLDFYILRMLTHEVTHARFGKADIKYPPKEKLPPDQEKCTKETLYHELSELAACISEFPMVAGLDSAYRDAWAKQYLTDRRKETEPHESIFGSIFEIRCSCACADADALIQAAFKVASALWTEKQRLEFHAYMKRDEGKKFGVYWPFEVPPRVGKVGDHELSFDLGVGFTGSSKLAVAMLSYNYVLSQWADGRLRLTAGAQANAGALLAPLTSPLSGEFGAGTLGLQYISTPKAVEQKFGGFTARLNTGLGAGEFLLTPVTPGGAETTGVRADYVLRVGAGIQFFIPGLTSLTPASLEAAYRLAQPLDSGAQRIHTFGLTLSFPLGK
jgi:hypothetical protein